MRAAARRSLVLVAWLLPVVPQGIRADTSTNTLTVWGVSRRFIVYVPATRDGGSPAPVLLMFHGHGSTAEQAASAYYDWQSSAESNGFIAVFPDSLSPPAKNIEYPPGTVLYPNYDLTGKRWDIVHVQSNDACRCESQDVAFVGRILDWLGSNFTIRTTHVFTTGHSYGALFSYYVAVCLPDRVRAFGEHSGGLYHYDVPVIGTYYWPVKTPAKPPALSGILIHSTGDTVVPYDCSLFLSGEMARKGHAAELVTLPQEMQHGWDRGQNGRQWSFFMSHAPMIDDDQDDMPDDWERENGLSVGVNDSGDDSDGDRASNLQEYWAGTLPWDSNSVFRVVSVAGVGAGTNVVAWKSATGRRYGLERSTNLGDGFLTVTSGLPSSPPSNVYTDRTAAAVVLYRVTTGVTNGP